MKLCEVARVGVGSLTKHQIDWLDRAMAQADFGYNKSTWQYNEQTGLVDINGDIRVYELSIPVPLGTVNGNVWLSQTIYTLKNAPRKVTGFFDATNCKHLTSFEGAPEWVGHSFLAYNAPITSLEGLSKHIGGVFECGTQWFIMHILQVFRYPQIKEIATGTGVDKIVNKHLSRDRDLLACQDELIEAGYARAARL